MIGDRQIFEAYSKGFPSPPSGLMKIILPACRDIATQPSFNLIERKIPTDDPQGNRQRG